MNALQDQQWRRQLAAIWISQFLAIVAFTLGLPFFPYYIQTLGVTDPDEVLFWTAVCQASAPLMFIITGPIWGLAADRWGRRPMLLRASVATVIILVGLATAPSVGWLVFWRLCQGLFTGTVTAARTLVVVSTPDDRQGFALGALSTALFCGLTTGQALGGLLAEVIGFRGCFLVGSVIAAAATLVVVFASREKFIPPPPALTSRPLIQRFFPPFHGTLPVLVVMAVSSVVIHSANPILPLLVQDVRGTMTGSSFVTGSMLASGAIAAAIAGLIIGMITDRLGTLIIIAVCSTLAALACAPMALVSYTGIPGLYIGQIIGQFMTAGLDPVFQTWLVRRAPRANRGTVLGWAATATSCGWMFGPLLASAAATITGLAPVYWLRAAGLLLIIPVAWWALRRMALTSAAASAGTSDPADP